MQQRRSFTFLLLLFWLAQSYTRPLVAAPIRPVGPAQSAPVAQASRTIILTDSGFSPDSVTVTVGDTVQWQNASGQTRTLRSGLPPRLRLPYVANGPGGPNTAARQSAFAPTSQFEANLPPGQSYSLSFHTAGVHFYYLEGSFFSGRIVVEEGAQTPPPDSVPATPQPLADAAAFLYTGPDAPQKGMAEDAIDPRRLMVLRGLVFDRAGHPLAGVRVTILGAPHFGHTFSAGDGSFNLALNGGGTFTVSLEKSGFLPVQRTVIDSPWQEYILLDGIVMTQLDPQVTTVDLTSAAPVQIVRGSPQRDPDGERQATLLVNRGITASMILADGTAQPLTILNVRATEYTVGDLGAMAMPGSLPANSGYTYAVEFSVDEALHAKAREVRFSQPLINYTENFIGAPVGSGVPTGYYDREAGRWVPSKNGRVIKIVGNSAGRAEVDITGDGAADSGDALAQLGISDDERQALATLYPVGQELWRVEIPHFTPWDHNWPFGPPPGAKAPKLAEFVWRDPNDPCRTAGSVIGCETQTVGESVALVGTPFSLVYQSDRVAGWRVAERLELPITGPVVPEDIRGILLTIDIAGRRYEQRWCVPHLAGAKTCAGLPDVGPNINYSFLWDGLDAFGRPLVGRPVARVTVTYIYELKYYPAAQEFAASFGQLPSETVYWDGRASCGNQLVGAWNEFTDFEWIHKAHFFCGIGVGQTVYRAVGAWDARTSSGLGGWTLNVHHAYDPQERVLYRGDGSRQSAAALGMMAVTLAGAPGSKPFPEAEGKPAVLADVDYLGDIAVGPDGSIFAYTGMNRNHIVKIDADGIIHTYAGKDRTGGNPTGDGGPALQATLGKQINGMTVGPDGSLYFALIGDSHPAGYIRKIDPNGIITTIAGVHYNYTATDSGDGGPASQARLTALIDLLLGPDGSLYFSEWAGGVNGWKARVRKIDPNGIVTTVVGGGDRPMNDPALTTTGLPATKVNIGRAYGLAFGPDGSFYLAFPVEKVVLRLGTDGLLTRFAGNGQNDGDNSRGPATGIGIGQPLKVAVDRNGVVYVMSDSALSDRVRIWRVDGNGEMEVVAGRATGCGYSLSQDGEAALATCIEGHSRGLEIGPDGALYYGDGRYQIRKLVAPLPGFGVGEFVLPSADGGELYEFDRFGRHLRTKDAVTGALRLGFVYDSAGRIAAVVDAYGNTTTIERAANGQPTGIVAPGGQRTALAVNGEGYLSQISNPLNQSHRIYYAAGGLISEFIQPGGESARYAYAADGRLVHVRRPNGEEKRLARIESSDALTVTVTTKGGLTTTYLIDTLPTGENRRRVQQPDGTAFVLLVQPDGSRIQMLADGSRITSTVAADPRWGMTAPYVNRQIIATPGGRVRETTVTKQVTGLSPLNPMSFATLRTEESLWNGAWAGRNASTTYDAASRTFAHESAEGKRTTVTVDEKGRVVQMQMGSSGTVLPILYSYDERGRLAKVAQGDLSLTNSYNGQNWLVSQRDAAGGTLLFENDGAGRVIRAQLPGGQNYHYAYDANGRRVSVTMPNGTVHTFAYSPVGDEAGRAISGQPGSLSRSFNSDGVLSSETLAGGGSRSFGFDPFGRLATSTTGYDRGEMSYDSATGQTIGMSRTPAGGTASTLQTLYDGGLPLRVDVGGLLPASFVYSYTSGFRLQSQTLTVGGESREIPVAWNHDQLLVRVGPFQWDRFAAQGAVSAISDENLRIRYDYDDLRRLASRTVSVQGSALGMTTFSYDKRGRLVGKSEVNGLDLVSIGYSYDANGQLLQVSRNGQVVEQYSYDANGNRLSRSVAGTPPVTASYDAQDRLTQLGDVTYHFDGDGFLTRRGADTFVYGVRGELLQAVVPGQTIRYSYDALNRRVARTSASGSRHFFYSDLTNPYRVTAVRDEGGVVSWLFYDEGGLLISLERQGSRFYVVTDQAGTPQLVTDSNGGVVKRLAWDSFGRLLSDSAPGFDLPIGFAGGLADGESGLVYFNWRDYDPAAGRWTARDPLAFAGSPRNLYAYAANDPVGRRDPLGLAELGFSVYAGPGGGASLIWEPSDPKSMAICAEAGVGVGGGLEFDLMEGLPRDREGNPAGNSRIIAEVGTKLGPLKLGLAGELDLECFNGKLKSNLGLGDFKVETDTEGSWTGKWSGFTPAKVESLSLGGKMEGKVAVKRCWTFGLPF